MAETTSRSASSGRAPRKRKPPPAPEPWGVETPEARDSKGRLSVLVEMAPTPGASPSFAVSTVHQFDKPVFDLDNEFEAISVNHNSGEGMGASAESFVVRGIVDDPKQIEEIRAQRGVAGVWPDVPIAPMDLEESKFYVAAAAAEDGSLATPCPAPPCDCTPTEPKGTMASVATFIGVNELWAQGLKGAGIVVAVADGGITAQNRKVKDGETPKRIPRVIGGWPADSWGTEAGKWDQHGNMCATDVLGMAPEAQLYDFRLSGSGGSPGTISRALQSFQWAIDRHRQDGTPHIITNSWGIYRREWDESYAADPNHPFTRKVVEAINAGIIVLFAAGNCGATCPDRRCGSDNGPGRDIWGANGHPKVITVGAVNPLGQYVGYSSQGPAALSDEKPDVCGISHFTGYFKSDTGTSAATPITAGVAALLVQAKKGATQDEIKAALKSTARQLGGRGFNRNTGAGIVQAKAAHAALVAAARPAVARPARPDECREGGATLEKIVELARRHPELRACLCFHLCGQQGPQPPCPPKAMAIVRRAKAVLEQCPDLREGFCRALRCAGADDDDCRRARAFLRRVLEAARHNPRLRACLCHFLCRQGPRPRCTPGIVQVLRRVASALRRCPQLRRAFCRGLDCRRAEGWGFGSSGDVYEDYYTYAVSLEDDAELDDDFDFSADLAIDDYEDYLRGAAFEADTEDDALGGLAGDVDDLSDFEWGGFDDEPGTDDDLDDLGLGPGADIDDLGLGPGADIDDLGLGPGADIDDLGLGPGADIDDPGAAPAPCPPAYRDFLRQLAKRAQHDPRMRRCLCLAFCRSSRPGPLPAWCRRYDRLLRRVRGILARCPQLRSGFCRALRCGPDCRRQREYLRRVARQARENRALRDCLCHFVCHQGSRPPEEVCRRFAALIRRVNGIMRRCPQLRSGFCRALGCDDGG